MHLAIKTSDKLQNTRAIRLLLYQGASTSVRDSSGNSALDIVHSLEESKIKGDILKLLTHKAGLVEQLGYRSSLKKVKKSWKFPSFYLLAHVVVYAISFFFTMPLWNVYMVYAAFGLFASSLIFWIVSMSHSPGFIKPHPKVEFLVSASFSHMISPFSSFSNSCS